VKGTNPFFPISCPASSQEMFEPRELARLNSQLPPHHCGRNFPILSKKYEAFLPSKSTRIPIQMHKTLISNLIFNNKKSCIESYFYYLFKLKKSYIIFGQHLGIPVIVQRMITTIWLLLQFGKENWRFFFVNNHLIWK